MFSVVGLGNPGAKYHYTRHSVGALFVEFMGGVYPALSNRKLYNLNRIDGLNLVSLNTYMNESGRAVLSLLSKENVKKEDLIIVYDDIDLNFGTIKLKQSGSDGGHKGVRSIKNAIGDNFFRVRIGIGRPNLEDVHSYVLSKFPEEEYTTLLNSIFPKLAEYIDIIKDKGIKKALGMARILK